MIFFYKSIKSDFVKLMVFRSMPGNLGFIYFLSLTWFWKARFWGQCIAAAILNNLCWLRLFEYCDFQAKVKSLLLNVQLKSTGAEYPLLDKRKVFRV